ncbi:uncharacterized protein LOC144346598 [Saccoglossus kowalevskii]
MENNSGCNVEKIENALEADVAMVTFGSPPDYDEMFDKISKRALDGSFLHLHPVSVTNSILVAGISQSTSTDTLELYFENKRRSGGGDEILDIAAFLPSTDDDVEEEEKEDVDRTVRMQREYEVLPPVEAKMEKRPESFTIQSSSSSSSDDNYTREDMDRKKRQYDWEEKSSDGSSIVVIPDQENMKESKEDSDLDEDDVENTIEVTDFSANTTVELLEMYFENRRKSGGGKVLKVEIASEKAYVTFEDPKVIDTVLQKTHLLSQCNLKVRIAPPLPPRDKRKVVVKNISEKTTRDGLELYMENNSGCNVEKIENALEADVAMVTFGSPPGNEQNILDIP